MTRNLNEPESSAVSGPPSASPILRGAFVHRMGESAEDEHLVARFWELRGFVVENLENSAERFSRRADLLMLLDGRRWGYCEVKTVWQHRRSVHILHNDGEEVSTELIDQLAEERIGGDLVTADRQLRAQNPDHELFNIVYLVNRDSAASFSTLFDVLTRQPSKVGRSLKSRREAMLAKEIHSLRKTIDLCLWAMPAADGELNIEGCFLFNPNLRSFAEEITGMRGAKVISLEPAA